ncbi:MAG: phosphoadenosine phosphosulfate reductase family protein, partial [Magnetococcus sp. DMHC-8]
MASHSKAVLTDEELKARYAWSLDRKIEESCDRIIDWHSRFGGRVSVSFSGGLDSTVLLDLVRNKCGYPDVPAVFSNTGLEFPENVHFVRSIPNVHEIRPKRGFRQVIETFGYPVVSKR